MQSYNSYSLEELFTFMKQSDQFAFNELYEKTWEKLYIKAKQKLNDENLAKEVIQDIYVDLWEKRHQREIKNISAYLNQILRFKVIDIYRVKKVNLANIDNIEEILIETTSSDNKCLENELELFLSKWINNLPEKRKRIFELYYWDNKTTKEIGEILKISKKTVQNQLLTSKSSLRIVLQKIFLLFLLIFFGI